MRDPSVYEPCWEIFLLIRFLLCLLGRWLTLQRGMVRRGGGVSILWCVALAEASTGFGS